MESSNRLEITSGGSIPFGVKREEFFAGYSIPRNKILMRVFKDLKIVEYLGSGMPRILKAYPKESFIFTANFIRTVFPISLEALELERSTTFLSSEAQVEAQVDLDILFACSVQPLSSGEIATALGHKKLSGNIRKALPRLKDAGLLAYTVPDKPNSRLQKYRLTPTGQALLAKEINRHE